MVNKNKLFHHIHHEFIKETCFELFDYADGFMSIYLVFCMLLYKNCAYIFLLIGLGYALQLQLKNKVREIFLKGQKRCP